MTTIRTDTRPSASTASDDDYYAPQRGAGWLFFAASILGLAGIMRIIDSFWAFSYHGALPNGLQDGALGSNLKHYAWLWLGVGIVMIISSFLVIAQNQFGRWAGIIGAAIGAVSAIFWMPYYPVWSLVYITLGVFVIYGLAVYGGRPRPV
jgi:hypothetical protein